MKFIPLNSIQQFDQLLADSTFSGNSFLLFKHSTRCLISKMAMKSFESAYQGEEPVYFLDLIHFRDISNHIERVTGIHHQSPQLIGIRAGKAVYHASHYSISANPFEKLV